jgi:hypothetical protein
MYSAAARAFLHVPMCQMSVEQQNRCDDWPREVLREAPGLGHTNEHGRVGGTSRRCGVRLGHVKDRGLHKVLFILLCAVS